LESLEIKSIIAGVLFGIWPLLMNRSGLSGNLSTFVFAAVVLLCVFPFSAGNLSAIGNAKWIWAIGAGIFGAFGLLSFNSVLSKAAPQTVGIFVVLMIIVQTIVPAVYQTIMNGGLPFSKIIGFVLAAVAAVLLLK
jgi:hypothetical protein